MGEQADSGTPSSCRQVGWLAVRQAEPLPLLTAGLDAAVQRASRLPLALLAVAGAVAQVTAAKAHPVCSSSSGGGIAGQAKPAAG
jgi:hypothetical protein